MRLQHKETLQIIEKSELNWKHLPNDRKELYTVLDGDNKPQVFPNFTPPELNQGNAAEKTDKPAAEKTDKPAASSSASDEETQDEKVLRLFSAVAPMDEAAKKELLKSIAKEVGAHFKTVESIVNKAAKA